LLGGLMTDVSFVGLRMDFVAVSPIQPYSHIGSV